MRKFLIFITFFLLSIYSFSQSSIKEVDDLASLTMLEKNSPSKIDTYSKIVRGYQNFDLMKAKAYNDSIFSLSKKIDYTKGYGYYFENKGYLLLVKGKPYQAIFYAKKAIQLSKRLKDTTRYLGTTWLLSQCYGSLDKYNKIIKVVENALLDVRNTEGRFLKEKGDLYQILSLAYSNTNNYKSISNLNNAVNNFKKVNDKYGLSNCYFTMVELYVKMEQFQKALYYFKLIDEKMYKTPESVYASYLLTSARIQCGLNNYDLALELNKKAYNLFVINNKKSSISHCLILNSTIYYKTQHFLESIQYAKKVLNNQPSDIIRFEAFQLLGKSYYKLKEYKMAAYYQNMAIAIFNSDYGFSIYEDISKTQFTLGNYQKAYLYNDIYAKGKINELIEDKNKNVNELQSLFELNEKELQLKKSALLRKQQKEQIEHQELFFNVLLICFFLAFILVLTVFYSYKKNKKKNYQLSEQNELIEQKNKILTESEEALYKLLQQKEILLKEIHHRVKNNLQLIMSLLQLQSRKNKNKLVDEFVQKSRSRIDAISLIHQNLYKSDDLEKINFDYYVKQLIDNIIRALTNEEELKIDFEIDICDVYFDLDRLIPIGLIINEIINNSIKYAFPDKKRGKISLTLREMDDSLHLTISDDGIGISNYIEDKSLGIRLIKQLVAQINGTVVIDCSKGVHYVINFKVPNN